MNYLKLGMNVNEYINKIEEKPCLLDVVYQDTKSDSKDWLDNYSLCDSYLKKFIYYRFNVNDNIDIDACIFMMPVYVALSNNIFQGYHYKLSTKKWRQFQLEIDKYPDKAYLRGDTVINAMSAVQQLFEYIDNKKLEKPSRSNYRDDNFRERYIGIVKYLLENEEEYEEILGLLNEHIKLCYSVGNFYPIMHKYDGGRRSLNNEKESCTLPGRLSCFDDVMSEWLGKVKKCFSCEEGCGSRIRKKYSYWFEAYSLNWNLFLTENELKPFVEGEDNNYTPKKYWKSTSNWKEKEEFLTDFQEYLKEINNSLSQRLVAVTNKVVSKKEALERCPNIFNL